MGKRIELTANQKLVTKKGVETKWTYLKDVEIRMYGKTYRRIILVRCECGVEKEVQLNNVSGGHSVCCGKASCKSPHNKGNRSIETSYNGLFSSYKRGAEKRGYKFELTKEEFKKFLNMNCYFCGSEPSNTYNIKNSKTKLTRAGVPIKYNGIDRVDNLLGYSISNCVPCCGTCNRMKTNHSLELFIDHIKKIYTNLIKNKDNES